MHEVKRGVLTPTQLKELREHGGMSWTISLTIDAESVYKSLTSADLKIPTEPTLLGHIAWIRELLQIGIVTHIQWCDTRDTTADWHTKGTIDRTLILRAMNGQQSYDHEIKIHSPFRPPK